MNYKELKKELINHKYTLLQNYQMDSLWDIMNKIHIEQTPGVLVETGVYRGGASIIMQLANKVYNLNKKIYLFDSFMGTPDKTKTKIKNPPFESHSAGLYKATQDEVIENFKRYDLWDDNIAIIPGWFEDTLSTFESPNIALLRFDGDLYSSTMDVMTNLYNKVVNNGYIIIDDYCLNPCKIAIDEFRDTNNIKDIIYTPYNTVAKNDEFLCASWWQKGSNIE